MKYFGKSWDNSQIYASLSSPAFAADMEKSRSLIQSIRERSQPLIPMLPAADTLSPEDEKTAAALLQPVFADFDQLIVSLRNMSVFANCIISVDGGNAEAKKTIGALGQLAGEAEEAMVTARLLLDTCSDRLVAAFLDSDGTRPHSFVVHYSRRRRAFRLSQKEESLLSALKVDGITAWGTLYSNISGTLKCEVRLPEGTIKTMGVAAATALTESPDEATRKAALDAVDRAWATQDEPCTAALNAITGWRLATYRRRSHTKPMHFLDQALQDSRIERATLDTLLSCVRKHRDTAQLALKLKARALKKKNLGPWDMFAPCPAPAQKTMTEDSGKMTFGDAIAMIADAYGSVNPEMGTFVQMMADRNWIEGTVSDSKRPGGYCTSFAKPREPRIYMTYTGGMKDVVTLAHELGHAFHTWTMRDLPLAESGYPMTLAETASIFGETLVQQSLLAKASASTDQWETLKVCWSDAKEAEGFLLNIPARYLFEGALNERRSRGTVSADDLRGMMRDAWSECYGETLSEMNEMFWASKLHFYISGVSFYNFPYTFGYLFALGVYAQRATLGADFFPAYKSLLRDTGRMTAEEVARKHLGVDLREPDFWNRSLAVVSNKVAQFEKVLGGLGF